MRKILIIDNYDSFTYNLRQLVSICASGSTVDVLRNDRFTLDDIRDYREIIISPGPGIPQDAGLIIPVIDAFKKEKRILGICLGHQAIGVTFGANLLNIPEVYHGVNSSITLDREEQIYANLPDATLVGRYHSWVVDRQGLPSCLKVTAIDKYNAIMSMRHKEHDIIGLQYHPESILTPYGKEILSNWLAHAR